MDNERLIEIVREYKYLYDLSDKKYSDNQKKDRAWNEIGIKLNRNGKECKNECTSWALLRDAFRRAIKKRKKAKSGQASVAEKKWKYEDEMSFLLPYMKERPTLCPIPTLPDCDNDDNANEDPQLPEDNRQMADISPSSPNFSHQAAGTLPSTTDLGQQTAATLPTTSSPTTQNYPRSKRAKKSIKRTEETPSTILMKYIIDSKKNTEPLDDIEQFMAGITTTLRSFPARDKAIAKAKIFEVVSCMEIEILSRSSSSNSTVSIPLSTTYSENTQMPNSMQDFYQDYLSTDADSEIQTFEHL